MSLREDLSKLINNMNAVTDEHSEPIVEQLLRCKKILAGTASVSCLDDAVRLARQMNSVRYIIDFTKPNIERSRLISDLTAFEKGMAITLCRAILDHAQKEGVSVSAVVRDNPHPLDQLEQLVVECDKHRAA